MATVYFRRDTDNALMRAIVGQGAQQIPQQFTNSSPFVLPGSPSLNPGGPPPVDTIYFRGIDNRLYRINSDSSGFSQLIGGKTISSTPFVLTSSSGGTRVYFQETDNSLSMIDPSTGNAQQIAQQSTSSTPFVVAGPDGAPPDRIYFQGTDNRLLRINSNDTNVLDVFPIPGQDTSSSPFVIPGANGPPDRIYFRGTDNRLLVVNSDGSNFQPIVTNWDSTPNKTSSSPYVVTGNNTPDLYQGAFNIDRVYFQGADNKLWVVNWDWGNNFNQSQHQINNNSTSSTPFVTNDLTLYFQGTNDVLWVILTNGVQTDNNYRTNSSPFVIE